MQSPSPSPSRVPLPPSVPGSRRSSMSASGLRSPSALPPHLTVSPRTLLRPRIGTSVTSVTSLGAAGAALGAAAGQGGGALGLGVSEPLDPFYEGANILINQPVGSLSISPSSRDVCLASRKGLYILDLANLESAPRFVPQGGTWQIADVQWSPHAVTDNLILSTSSQKLLVWDLAAQRALYRSIDAHGRAITDINWHPLDPNLMATTGMDSGIRGWDLRTSMARPFMRLSMWGVAGTQVEWNRHTEHVLATAHGKEVVLWDKRKGSIPMLVLKAHDAKIYGIDWDRFERHKLVTCSLDKTIKSWHIPALAGADAALDVSVVDGVSNGVVSDGSSAPPVCTETIVTSYPVWRARNLPFGHGVLSLPQRGDTALEMFGVGSDTPVERFEGSGGVAKDFVWRVRGGTDASFDDREFQLVTWSKDRRLRVWPVPREVTERVGFKYGTPIPYTESRIGSKDRTYTISPGGDGQLPPPGIGVERAVPSGIARQRLQAQHEAGMTRGGGTARAIDQIEWLAKVVKTKGGPGGIGSDSSPGQSRATSVSRSDSNSRSRRLRHLGDNIRPLSHTRGGGASQADVTSSVGTTEMMPLKDEVVVVRKMFPRSKVNFERRKLTMSLSGPWANGDRMAFMRIHWTFPPNYPYGPEIPTFELERNATVSSIARHRITTTIKELRSANRQCIVSVTEFLLGYHERQGRRLIDEDSGSESEDVVQNVPMLKRTSGAVFGPNGQLVCFFPKQTVLPRARTSISRSPTREAAGETPLARAISALSRLENPNKPTTLRYRRHVRRLQALTAPVQARSTLTIHPVAHLTGEPDLALAAVYTTTSIDSNLVHALDAKRLDHAQVWATLRALTEDPPPPYWEHAPLHRSGHIRRERLFWEREMERKRRVLDELFDRLMDKADIQLLALVACVLVEHEKRASPPPPAEEAVTTLPDGGYFHLPPTSGSDPASAATPGTPLAPPPLRRSNGANAATSVSSSGPSSFRTSGWSQILMNPSSISLRGIALTPRDRTSFEMPHGQGHTPGGSLDETHINTVANAATPAPVTPTERPPPVTPTYGPPVWGVSTRSPVRGVNIPRSGGGPLSTVQAGVAATTMSPRRRASTSIAETYGLSHSGYFSHRRDHSISERPTRPRPLSVTSTHTQTSSSPGGPAAPTTPLAPSRSYRVSFGNGSPLRRAFRQQPATRPPPRRMCGVGISLIQDDAPHTSLLREDLRPLADIWKLVYADILLRAGLVGRRAALLQYVFAQPDAEHDGEVVSARAASGQMGEPHLELATMCPFCKVEPVSPRQERCENCERRRFMPLCSVCRQPVKGLATTCTVCSHTSHTRCLRAILTSPADHCPACTCCCLSERGVSGGFQTAPKAPPSRAIAYGFMSSSTAPRSRSPGLDFDGPHLDAGGMNVGGMSGMGGSMGLGMSASGGLGPPIGMSEPRSHRHGHTRSHASQVSIPAPSTRGPIGAGGGGAVGGFGGFVPGMAAYGGIPYAYAGSTGTNAGTREATSTPGPALESQTQNHAQSHNGKEWDNEDERETEHEAWEREKEQREREQRDAPLREGLLARSRLRALGTEGILGW